MKPQLETQLETQNNIWDDLPHCIYILLVGVLIVMIYIYYF